MLSFESDYIEGAHEEILKRIMETNYEQIPGYGTDKYCASAAAKIKLIADCPDAEVRFLVGGTQTNSTIIATMLGDYEGVVAADTGHVSLHEAGAVEYTGHKVLNIPGHDGKIDAAELKQYLVDYHQDDNREHMVFPGMVYISHPTEYGTLYTKQELEEIAEICREYEIPLFLDGARLGYGLMSRQTDVTLPVIAKYCDVFYIGGTKVGALFGEAVVFKKERMPKHFLTMQKQHGALLAKGWLLGLQFDTLFTDDLYFNISGHAIDMAEKLKTIFQEKNYQFYLPPQTNQLFLVLENEKMKELEKKIRVGFWEKYDENHTVVRFATSWATRPEAVEELASYL